jgi:hypothetical protein
MNNYSPVIIGILSGFSCIFLLVILIFKGLTARRLYKSFGVKGLNNRTFCPRCIYAFCVYLKTNSDLCHLDHKLVGFL